MPKSADEQAIREKLALRLIEVGQVASERMLAKLTWRERQVVRLRTGLGYGFPYTLEAIGRIFNLPRASVRGVERRAMAKLAAMLEEEEKDHAVQID